MNINLDSNILETFDQLDELYEDVNKEASKKFWADAKERKIDERAFHAAFDEELAKLGLSDIFDKQGRLANKGVYGKIKEAADANPENWAVKAALKLWVLQYKDGAEYQIAIENKLKWQEAEKLKAEAEAKAKAEREQKEKELLDDAITKLDQKIKDDFETFVGKSLEQECSIVDASRHKGRWLSIASSKFIYEITRQETFTVDELIKTLERVLPKIIAETERNVKGKVGAKFDIFKALTNHRTYARAVLLGESGTIYEAYISNDGNTRVEADNNDTIKYLSDITEPYKIIFTSVSQSDDNYSTYRDSVSKTHYSWDSSEADKLTHYLPKLGHTDGVWSYSDVEKVDNPTSSAYSKMDNIDTWAYGEHTAIATD